MAFRCGRKKRMLQRIKRHEEMRMRKIEPVISKEKDLKCIQNTSAQLTEHIIYLSSSLVPCTFSFRFLFLLFISSLSFIIRVRINNDQWDLSVCKLCFVQMKKNTRTHTTDKKKMQKKNVDLRHLTK